LASPNPVAVAAVLNRMKPRPSTPLKAETFSLSDDTDETFYLQVRLTTLGAGVQKVTLPKFDAATVYGRPRFDERGKPLPFDLIPDDPVRPSFLLFHYVNPQGDVDDPNPAKRAVPLDYLGNVVWKAKPVEQKGDARVAEFWFDEIPDFEGIKIV